MENLGSGSVGDGADTDSSGDYDEWGSRTDYVGSLEHRQLSRRLCRMIGDGLP